MEKQGPNFLNRARETHISIESQNFEREQKFQNKATKRLNKKLQGVLPIIKPEEIGTWELIPPLPGESWQYSPSWENFYKSDDHRAIAYTEIDGVGIAFSKFSSLGHWSEFYVCTHRPEPYFGRDVGDHVFHQAGGVNMERFGGIRFTSLEDFTRILADNYPASPENLPTD